MTSRIELKCREKGLKMTEQRRTIAAVLSDSTDHPDAAAVYRRAIVLDPRISMATVYRPSGFLKIVRFWRSTILAMVDPGTKRHLRNTTIT